MPNSTQATPKALTESEQVTLQNQFESIFKQHLAGELKEAERGYRNLLRNALNHSQAQHYLGVVLHQMGDTDAGLTYILRALETDTENISSYNDLGNIYTQIGNLAHAATAFSKALELNENDAIVWNNYGSVLHRQHKLDEGERAYRKAIELDNGFVSALTNLAMLLAEKGCIEEASWYECLAYIQPPHSGKSPITLGASYYRLNRIAEAAEHYRTWLNTDSNNAFALHHLAACTGENIPAKASDSYLKTVFDAIADRFDEKLVGKLMYRGPEIMERLLGGHLTKNKTLNILDAGCGTGLCGSILKPYAKNLTGVDISPGMLAKAHEAAVYDTLVEMELTAYLAEKRASYDVISMADTLIYFGDLAEIVAVIRQALKSEGLFAFTAEITEGTNEQVDYVLSSSGRYTHSYTYLTRLISANNFKVLQIDEVVIRMELGCPTMGLAILIQALPR